MKSNTSLGTGNDKTSFLYVSDAAAAHTPPVSAGKFTIHDKENTYCLDARVMNRTRSIPLVLHVLFCALAFAWRRQLSRSRLPIS